MKYKTIKSLNSKAIDEIYLRDLYLFNIDIKLYPIRIASLFFTKSNSDVKAHVIVKMCNFSLLDLYLDDNNFVVEDYKLIFDKNTFYLSLDPDQKLAGLSDNDCGVIISEYIEWI
ncbi:MAG: hypothetical protein K0R65_2742 [Crocinitomicaceae bacterium]|jgi:hypothetical protein|nr:hypothetical protein [Crocinitomicaceae bacterium]